ncbi:MAG: hypothetical protein ACNA70_02375 [Brevefilum sp.]
MDPILTLSYTPEKRDYIRASRLLLKKSPWFLFLAGLIALLVVGAGIVLAFPGLVGAQLRSAAVFVLLFGLAYLVYILLLIPVQLNKAFKTKPHMRMARTLHFFTSHLHMRIGEDGVELPWEHLHQVIDGGDGLLMLFRGEERVFPFIPERAFENRRDRDVLMAFFREKSIPVL